MPPQRRQSWYDVVDVQADLANWYRTPHGKGWVAYRAKIAGSGLDPKTVSLINQSYSGELDRIEGADPIFVSNEMVDVVDAAMGSFQPEPLVPFDLTTPTGFIYLERPIEVTDRFDEPTMIQGFSWVPAFGADFAQTLVEEMADLDVFVTAAGVTAQVPTERAEYAARLLAVLQNRTTDFTEMGTLAGLMLTVYAKPSLSPKLAASLGRAPAVIPIHCTPWWFGMEFDGNDVDEKGVPTGAAWWWKILQTTLRLMQQPLAATSFHDVDNAGSRARAKAKLPDDRDIVVVRLRRETQTGQEGGPHSEANYSHRFWRNAHWRNQWYPASKCHRQIWIHSTIVGDDSLPLIIRPNRAFVWTR